MSHDNPYTSPTHGGAAADAIDPKSLQLVATYLAAARQNPPTVLTTLWKSWGKPTSLLVIVASLLLLVLLSTVDSTITYWFVALAGVLFGAVLRDVIIAVSIARLWRPQAYFIDWAKVDEFTA